MDVVIKERKPGSPVFGASVKQQQRLLGHRPWLEVPPKTEQTQPGGPAYNEKTLDK